MSGNRTSAAGVLLVVAVLGLIGAVGLVVYSVHGSRTSVTSTQAGRLYMLGAWATDGGWSVEVAAVHDPWSPGGTAPRPAAGMHFVAIEVVEQNNTARSSPMSPALCSSLRGDGGRIFRANADASAQASKYGLPDIGATVKPHEEAKATIVYEVPEDAGRLVLNLCEQWGSKGLDFMVS